MTQRTAGAIDTEPNDDNISISTNTRTSNSTKRSSSNKPPLLVFSFAAARSMLSFRYVIVLPALVLVVHYFYSILQIQQQQRRGGKLSDATRPPTSSSWSSSTERAVPPTNGMTCDYYLAESTIPNAGWGIFTYRTLYQNDMIDMTNGESGISVVDLTTQHGNYLHTLYSKYMWNADVIGSHNEGGGRSIYTRTRTRTRTRNGTSNYNGTTPNHQQQQPQKSLLPGNVLTLITGIGMLSNGHPLDYNIVPYQIPIPHPPLATTGSTDFAISRHSNAPTTGAITYYHHLQYFAYDNHKAPPQSASSSSTRSVVVPAGGELIINYGTGWNARFDFQQYRIHPPDRPKQNTHSLPYLQRHGYCMDSIVSSYPYVSNIVPHAGYGGLARRTIPNNTVIIPIPTIPIHRYGLHMDTRSTNSTSATSDNSQKYNEYADDVDDEFDEDEDPSHSQKPPSTTTIIRQQLLLNYVFGHVHSNVLLVPYGPGIHLINHHSTRYNAKLRWSARETTTSSSQSTTSDNNNKRRPSWVIDPEQITIQQLMEEQPGGKLVLELVAIQDIAQGEEILIHYGSAWEDAYQRHHQEWEHSSPTMPNNDDGEYVYAFTKNQLMEHQPLLLTEAEQMDDPYPYNLQLECYYVPHLYHEVTDDTNSKYMEWDSNNAQSMMHVKQMYHPNQLRPCQILHRLEMTHDHHNEYVYHVQLIDIPYIVHNVPRHMITFRDVPYTQDQFKENVFRHEIQLPDDVFPHNWKDLL